MLRLVSGTVVLFPQFMIKLLTIRRNDTYILLANVVKAIRYTIVTNVNRKFKFQAVYVRVIYVLSLKDTVADNI